MQGPARRARAAPRKQVPFTQQDPIGIAGGLNLYGFAGGDPINYQDPFGLCASAGGSGSGSSGGDGGAGQSEPSDEKSECEQLAARSGQIAATATSVADFGERMGRELAGVSGAGDLIGGGRNMISASAGGYRDEFGGDALGQARHFAASVFASARFGETAARAGFGYNETFRPGANQADGALSVSAFDMYSSLQRGQSAGSSGLQLHGGSVMNWILQNVCKRPRQ